MGPDEKPVVDPATTPAAPDPMAAPAPTDAPALDPMAVPAPADAPAPAADPMTAPAPTGLPPMAPTPGTDEQKPEGDGTGGTGAPAA